MKQVVVEIGPYKFLFKDAQKAFEVITAFADAIDVDRRYEEAGRRYYPNQNPCSVGMEIIDDKQYVPVKEVVSPIQKFFIEENARFVAPTEVDF